MQNNKTPQYTVSHYMHTTVITAAADITLKEAVEIMLKSETNGLVVVDKEQRVVGILSSWDIIQYIVPDYLEEDRHLASFEAGDIFFSRTKRLRVEISSGRQITLMASVSARSHTSITLLLPSSTT